VRCGPLGAVQVEKKGSTKEIGIHTYQAAMESA
jgi:hypothetical protein